MSKKIAVGVFAATTYKFNSVRAVAKERTLHVETRGGKSRRWSPQKTRYFEKTIIANATAEQHPSLAPYEGPLSMQLNIRFPDQVHGDIDNLEKAMLDGMQKIAFKNDKQIKSLHADLFFEKGQPPMIEAVIAPWQQRPWSERTSVIYLADSGHCPCCPHSTMDIPF